MDATVGIPAERLIASQLVEMLPCFTPAWKARIAIDAAAPNGRAIRATRAGTAGPVDVPTTYAWGTRDLALGRRAAELTAEHVRGPYRFVELDAGHWLPETRAEELAGLVLERVGGTANTP